MSNKTNTKNVAITKPAPTEEEVCSAHGTLEYYWCFQSYEYKMKDALKVEAAHKVVAANGEPYYPPSYQASKFFGNM